MKIGIFGGTFDPPHLGHKNALKAMLDNIELEKIYVIPVFLPPHKNLHSNVSPKMRLEMTKIAFKSLSKKIEISDLEIKRQGMSYTAYTIEYFKNQGHDIYFLCGTDMFLTLDTWYKPRYIFANSTIVLVRREDSEEISKKVLEKAQEYKDVFDAKIIILSAEAFEASSTDVRMLINSGEDHHKILSDEIYDYIIANNLYRNE